MKRSGHQGLYGIPSPRDVQYWGIWWASLVLKVSKDLHSPLHGCTLKHPEKRSILQLGSCEGNHSRAPGSKYIFSIFCKIGFFAVIVFVVVCCQELNSKSKKYVCWVSVDFCPSFPDGQFSSRSQKIPFEKKSKIPVFSGGN